MPRSRCVAASLLLLLVTACSGSATPATTTAPVDPTTTTVAGTTPPTEPPTVEPTTTTVDPATTITATTTTTTETTTTGPGPLVLPETFDPHGATIPELQAAMTEGRLTSVLLVGFYLNRIADLDGVLHAMLYVNPNAIVEAGILDEERRAGVVRGPLHGIPIVLKDNIGTADMPTTAGSVALAGFIPNADATQVARLRAAGAIILGKTNLHEFARDTTTVSSLGGQTHNPYDTGRYPGGSSGGTGAALAAEFASAGLGTDTCGSIRIPAAFNHLYGLRPTTGLTPVDGVIPLTFTEDTVGPMARSVIDLAIVLDATSDGGTRYASAAARGSLDGIRIGVLDVLFTGADPAVNTAVRAALDRMAANGAEVVPAPIPGFDQLRGNAATVFLSEWRFAFDAYLASQPAAPVPSLAAIVASGQFHASLTEQLARALAASIDTAEYRDAQARRGVVRAAIEGYLVDHDLDALAYPTMTQPPALIGTTQRGSTCGTASVGGLPAIVVPAGFTAGGLPVGLELMGAGFSEAELIAIAAGYERVAPARVPPGL